MKLPTLVSKAIMANLMAAVREATNLISETLDDKMGRF